MDGVMKSNLTENYIECLEKGLKYQDFVTDLLIEDIGIALSTYNSKNYQFKKGENKQGFEIKFDDRLKETGNLYIEIAEKSNPNNFFYIQSGIYRNDNTWLYLIGDYSVVYIFAKNFLQKMCDSNKYKKVQTKTSKGFLIPKIEAEKYCIKKIKTF